MHRRWCRMTSPVIPRHLNAHLQSLLSSPLAAPVPLLRLQSGTWYLMDVPFAILLLHTLSPSSSPIESHIFLDGYWIINPFIAAYLLDCLSWRIKVLHNYFLHRGLHNLDEVQLVSYTRHIQKPEDWSIHFRKAKSLRSCERKIYGAQEESKQILQKSAILC